ncbi:GNAT family N-acetyltransferase [Paraburkholderia sp. BCC1885]|uniref:GNAT family N-acetyltransferase n=1 Tax=Paraburkholderia sp. BCC1885 TaxID=2562669 RepID=UPI0011826AF7|nr:GNAT family N-acetyltransferase [Paraburkholderia sp. BCC1885]
MNTSSERFERAAQLTGRVIVRACETSDMEAIAALRSLPGVRRGTLTIGYRTAENMAGWFAKVPKSSINLCAELDGQLVGHAVLEPAVARRAHCAGLGLSVHDAWQGRGVGKILMSALIECADRSLGLRRLELTVFADNAPAIALYRRFGFVEEGRSRGYAMRDGMLADVLHMARLADAPSFAQH